MPPRAAPVSAEQSVDAALAAVSAAGDDLEDVLSQAERDVEDVFQRRHNELRPALDDLDAAKARLLEAVRAHPKLFVKPRSRTGSGVRVQCRKGADRWDYDAEASAALIREHEPALAHAISTATVIDHKKLAHLTPAKLKKLGIVRTSKPETVAIVRQRDDLDERMERVRHWLS